MKPQPANIRTVVELVGIFWDEAASRWPRQIGGIGLLVVVWGPPVFADIALKSTDAADQRQR